MRNAGQIDTLFATISNPSTPNLQFLVQSSLQVLSSILPAVVALDFFALVTAIINVLAMPQL